MMSLCRSTISHDVVGGYYQTRARWRLARAWLAADEPRHIPPWINAEGTQSRVLRMATSPAYSCLDFHLHTTPPTDFFAGGNP
jgi:hypothetical protein